MPQPDVCSPWPVDLCCQLPDDLDQEVIARWQLVASQILFRLSGRRWGPSCPVTVRPCRRSCLDSAPVSFQAGVGTGPWVPYIGADGMWRNASVCGCASSCSCTELCEVRLDGPVYDIVEVLVDGEALVPEAYRVDSPNLLVRTDGECWPDCQDMAAPCGAPGTVCVTYRTGLPLDAVAIAAVSELTCELIKACPEAAGSCGTCRLPGNVTRAVRQGVTVEMVDPTLIFQEGRTGLPLVDLWLSATNPYRLASPSRVYSPDHKRPRMTTWP
ncbi:hypothetical protein OHA04_45760 (plasmid) [Streptomyces sp. NBC_01590]|uniref:hypothetical protein n=1 Tax=Streptomyces sp. NBC_01590 TaxID=2975887 RepID=UPI002F9158E3